MSSYFKYFIDKLSISKKLKKGSLIIAKVVKIINNIVILDANLKSEIYMPIREFISHTGELEAKENCFFELLVESLDNEEEKIVLSRNKLRNKGNIWLMNDLFNKNMILKGFLEKKLKGGFNVIIKNFKCFLPFTSIDKKLLLNNSYFIGKSLLFKISLIDIIKKIVILNRKNFLKRLNERKRIKFINNLKEGKLIKGVVKNITSYGVFIDLGYADAIILTRNISWKPKKHSNEVIKLNQSLIMRILRVDKKKRTIFLGLKNVIIDPWFKINLRYKIGYIKYARVYKITNDTFFFILEKSLYTNIKKFNVNKFFRYKKNINKIKINSYVKLKIKNLNKKNKIIDVELIWFYS